MVTTSDTSEHTLADSPIQGMGEEKKVLTSDESRLQVLGVDFSKYPALYERKRAREIVSRTNRGLAMPLIRSYANRVAKKVPNPMMLTHILTTRCNYRCSFCSFSDTLNDKTDDLTLQEIERAYTTLGDNLNVIVYSGGETTLNKDLASIIQVAYQRTPVKSVYIISNAWKPDLLFEITHEVMQRCPGLHLTWSLSIEGPRETNNAERRTYAPDWDAWQNTIDTMEGLKHMREAYGYKELNVQLCTVCSPGNYHLLDGWYETIRDRLQPDKWNLNLMRKSVQMTDHGMASFEDRRSQGDLEPFERKYLEMTQRVQQDVFSGRLKFLYYTKNPYDGAVKSAVDLISQEENRRTVLEKKGQFVCCAGYTGVYIGNTGDVSGCEEFANNPDASKVFGNLREANYDFQEIWHSPKAERYREQVGQAKECRGCTLESQRNYPSILVSFKTLVKAGVMATQIKK